MASSLAMKLEQGFNIAGATLVSGERGTTREGFKVRIVHPVDSLCFRSCEYVYRAAMSKRKWRQASPELERHASFPFHRNYYASSDDDVGMMSCGTDASTPRLGRPDTLADDGWPRGLVASAGDEPETKCGEFTLQIPRTRAASPPSLSRASLRGHSSYGANHPVTDAGVGCFASTGHHPL
ncbi:hypothetical protein CBL_06151 [Carabus blaptoides fortunei]